MAKKYNKSKGNIIQFPRNRIRRLFSWQNPSVSSEDPAASRAYNVAYRYGYSGSSFKEKLWGFAIACVLSIPVSHYLFEEYGFVPVKLPPQHPLRRLSNYGLSPLEIGKIAGDLLTYDSRSDRIYETVTKVCNKFAFNSPERYDCAMNIIRNHYKEALSPGGE